MSSRPLTSHRSWTRLSQGLGDGLEGFGGGRGRGRGAFFAPNARICQERDPAEVEKERALRARAVLSESVKPVMVGWLVGPLTNDSWTR